MKIIKEIGYSWRQVMNHWQDYFKTVVILHTVQTIIAVPLLSYLFFKVLNRAGVASITDSNFKQLFHNPVAVILGIIFLLLLILLIFYDLGFYFLIAESHGKNQKVKLWEIFRRLNKKAKYFLSVYSLFFVAYFLLLVPIVSIGMDTELTAMIKIPDFIVDELLLTNKGIVLFTSLTVILTYIAIRLIYLIYFFVLDEEATIWQSIKKSWLYSRGRSWHNLIVLVLMGSLFALVILSLTLLIFVPMEILIVTFPPGAPFFAGLALSLMQLIIFLVGGLLQPLTANVIVATTLLLSGKKEKIVTNGTFLQLIHQSKLWLKLLFVVVFSLVLLGNYITVNNLLYAPQTKIIAHRGFMERGVENSLGGLAASAAVGADLVELDIQETADQQFVVMHDYNLKRLARRNQDVYQLSLAELTQMPIYQNGHEDRIPSLREFIQTAVRLKIGLLIEIKPHGHESPAMIANLVKLLREEKVNDKFLVQSLDLDLLNQVKDLAPEIKTGYVMPLNLGNLPELKHDFYVLEEFSLSKRIINQAREEGKEIFVWTINTDELLQKYLNQDLGGIITNRPERGVSLRDESVVTDTFLNRVIYLLDN